MTSKTSAKGRSRGASTRTRSDSSTAAVDAMVNAALPPLKPAAHSKLRKEDMPFWDGIIVSRARDEWTEADLVVAAQLARVQRDIEVVRAALQREQLTVTTARGSVIANPKLSVIESLTRIEMAIMRTLRMAGTSTGPTRDLRKKRALEKTSRAVRASVEDEDDDLLAR